ncbi:MAG: FixH family protein [Chlorobiaceae bacterium]|nr:FixH family protein [Chlorobiaceae bacterium]
MKPFIIGLYVLFIVAMISGVTIAYRNAEGLMEPDYYQKQKVWFREKSLERQIGFEVQPPESLTTGSNMVQFIITRRSTPFEKASVTLFVGRVSDKKQDFSCPMRETAPGVYVAQATLPSKGKCLVRIELTGDQLKTSRSWFYDIR